MMVTLLSMKHINMGTNMEWKFRIRILWLQIQLEYATVSRCFAGTRRHLVATGTSPCRSRRHRRHTHRSFRFLSYQNNDFLQPPNLSSHILCTYTHNRLQIKIIYISVKNKIKKTNSRKIRHDLRRHADHGAYRNIVNISQASLNKMTFTNSGFILTLK